MPSRFGLLTLLALPASATAQSGPDFPVGLGVGILSSITVRVPIRLGHAWRLEPSVGIDFDNFDQVGYQSGQATDTAASSSHLWTLAVAVSRRFPVEEGLDFHLGPRLALTRNSAMQEVPASAGGGRLGLHRLDIDLGAVAAAELTLRRRFSLGGEVGAAYRFRGTTVVTQPLPPNVVLGVLNGGHRVFTYGDVLLRWYFGHAHSGQPRN
jgi:hypothetical protein